MSEREGANIYEDFKEWLHERFTYEKDTPYPVTYRQITRNFPLSKECSSEVLTTFIEEMNGGEARFTTMETEDIVPCYRNLTFARTIAHTTH